MDNYIINFGIIQQVETPKCIENKGNSKDTEKTAQEKQKIVDGWQEKKNQNMYLADCYASSNMANGKDKARRMSNCGRWLEFAIPPNTEKGQKPKLVKASSCHVRLCPICQWRRTLSTYRNLATIYTTPEESGYKHLFLTLTQKNIDGKNLSDEIKKINAAYTKMMKRKELNFIVGSTKTVEVTHNENTDKYHPHIHAILSVPKSYGKKIYVSQKRWTELWRSALNINYDPRVDIRIISVLDGKTVAEVAKYSVKPADYIFTNNPEKTKKSIETIDPQLDGKRFISLSGTIKKAKSDLKIKEIEAEQYDSPEGWKKWERVIYEWNFAKKEYQIKDL